MSKYKNKRVREWTCAVPAKVRKKRSGASKTAVRFSGACWAKMSRGSPSDLSPNPAPAKVSKKEKRRK
jgi:hypothetical protein